MQSLPNEVGDLRVEQLLVLVALPLHQLQQGNSQAQGLHCDTLVHKLFSVAITGDPWEEVTAVLVASAISAYTTQTKRPALCSIVTGVMCIPYGTDKYFKGSQTVWLMYTTPSFVSRLS